MVNGLPHVVHLTYGEGMTAVFFSQVARPMSLMRRRGYGLELMVFAPLGQYLRAGPRGQWRARRQSLIQDFGLDVARLPLPPARAQRLWGGEAAFRLWLRRRFRSAGERVILHCRGAEAANLATSATGGDARYRVIFDCRGLDAPEHLLVHGYRTLEDAPAAIAAEAVDRADRQRRAAVASHAMICVSEVMKREVVDSWRVPPERVRVIPCASDIAAGATAYSARSAMRDRLGIGDRFVVAYCGSLEAWQMPRESLAVFQRISRQRSDAHFLGITTHVARLEAFADEAGIKPAQRSIFSVPHLAVPAYLAAADVGLLIRADSAVNRVASPVKFGEYLSCGVPVILTEGVGDFSTLVTCERLGCVLGMPLDAAAASAALGELVALGGEAREELRSRCLNIARMRLGWQSNVDTLDDIYARLATDR